MPSIQTLVSDLNNGSVTAIGAKPPSNETNRSSVVDEDSHIKYRSVHMNATISDTNRLSFNSAVDSTTFNGNYLHYQDDQSTLAILDINRPLVASGNFSGCAYKVFRDTSGDHPVLLCAHIARPSSPNSDRLVNLIDAYAGNNSWEELQSIGTMGHIGSNNCTEVILVTQLLSVSIDTILLEVSNTGAIVGTSDRTTTQL